jgi:PAS domain S-box-containing protein
VNRPIEPTSPDCRADESGPAETSADLVAETPAEIAETSAEILVVDDTPANLRLLTNILAEQGYRVRPALGGVLALRSVAMKPPDLILLDVRMPEIDGYTVCRHLKADPTVSAVPVIFISALNESTDKIQGFAAGGVDYITKPFEPSEVLVRIRTHLELWRLQQRQAQIQVELEKRVRERTSELAEANLALRSSEERLRLVIDATSDGVWDWNPRTDVSFYSDRWYAMLDYAPGEFEPTHANWIDRIHPEDRPAVEAAIQAHFDRQTPYNMEFRMRAKAGDWKWIHSRGKLAERDATGFPLRMVGTHTDITERKRAEAELARHREHLKELVAERTAELRQAMNQLVQVEKLAALGNLVAGMAHELNTPLGNARTVASALGEHLAEFAAAAESGALRRSQLEMFLERSREAVGLLERNTARAADLIGQFKQVAVDQTSVRRRRFGLRQTVEEVLATLQPLFKRTAHRVELDIPPELELDSHPGPLEQVVANLAGNSISHGFEGIAAGLIEIRAAPLDEERVQIDYADNGVGIPEANLARIFEPFFTTQMGQGGSGLGLYIVYSLVTGLLGGTIEVDSAPGQGARFILVLPRTAPTV